MHWIAASAWDCRTTTAPWDCAALALWSTMPPWRRPGRSAGRPRTLRRHGRSRPDADRERLRLACGEWAIPGALERTGRTQGFSPPRWQCPPLAHGPCRTPVCRPRQRSALQGALVAGKQGSDPSLLTDKMQTCFLQQLIPIHSLPSLADKLQAKRQKEGNGWKAMIWNSSTVTAISRHTSGAASPTCLRNWRL